MHAGSSPLTRGKLVSGGREVVDAGLIPAHAGKTASGMPRRLMATAHPRSRGENSMTQNVPLLLSGSSPLTRGKRFLGEAEDVEARLIPAHAGKTCPSARAAADSAAHPRSRGENGHLAGHDVSPSGSSPLTRGKLLHPEQAHVHCRLIPAHAGKTGERD